MDSRIKTIADHYGYEAQSRQCMEECAELIQAINKLWRAEEGYTGNNATIHAHRKRVIEEMADVEIMIRQMKYMLAVADMTEWAEEINSKLERQMQRMKEEKNAG